MDRTNRGAAYNSSTDTWRTIAEPPGRSVTPYPQAVWTGDRAIVELGAAPDEQPIPLGARPALVWTGSELLMLGGGKGTKAARNPTTDECRDLATTDATLLNNTPVWTGDAALFWNGGGAPLAYLPATDSWTTLAGGALSVRESPASVWADGIFITWSGFQNNSDGTGSVRPTVSYGALTSTVRRPVSRRPSRHQS